MNKNSLHSPQGWTYTFFVLIILLKTSTLSAETTFVSSFDNITSVSGSARFTPEYKVGSTCTINNGIGTYSDETVDLPAQSAPTLSGTVRVHSGPQSLSILGGRDGVNYTALATGNINRAMGTAEGFFQTPYDLGSNSQPLAFLAGSVLFSGGTAWAWEIKSDGNTLYATFSDNSSGGGSVTLTSTPFSVNGNWKPNIWHHVALTWRASTGGSSNGVFQLFVDGKLVAKITNGTLPVTAATETENRIYIGMTSAGFGSKNSGQTRNLEGYADNIRFDNTELYDGSTFAVGDQAFAPLWAESWRNLKPFRSNDIPWTSSFDTTAIFKSFDHRTTGYELTCNMDQVPTNSFGYCMKQCSPALDMSQTSLNSLIAYLKITNAAAIESINLVFSSDTTFTNYYDLYFQGSWGSTSYLQEGWNTLGMDRTAFSSYIHGSPDLSNIVMVKINVWKRRAAAGTGTVKVELYDVELSPLLAKNRPWKFSEYDLPLPPRANERDAGGMLLESRMILDEGPWYISSDGSAATTLLNRIASAGFNAYMPNVWHGRGAKYKPSTGVVLDAGFSSYFSGAFDPFADLIAKAHSRTPKIEIHPWWTISMRQAEIYPEYAPSGTPIESGRAQFDLHHSGFRDFIVNEIVQFAAKYDIDGINLDYIRTIGVSTSTYAQNEYNAMWGPTYSYAGDNIANYPNLSADALNRLYLWQDAAVADIVRRISEGVRAIRPNLIISISGHPSPDGTWNYQGRNEWKWVDNEWADVVWSMDYNHWAIGREVSTARSGSPFPQRYSDMGATYDDAIWTGTGSIAPRDGDLINKQLDYYLRKFPERGVALYIYNPSTMANTVFPDSLVSTLAAGVFKEPAKAYYRKSPTINGTVTLSDFGGDNATQSVIVDIINPWNSTVSETRTVPLTASGGYSYTASRDGTYHIAAKGSHWLKERNTNIPLGTNPVNFTLTNGDCNADNIINADDLSLLLAAIDTVSGDPSFDNRTNLDGDIAITSTDLAILLKNMDLTGD